MASLLVHPEPPAGLPHPRLPPPLPASPLPAQEVQVPDAGVAGQDDGLRGVGDTEDVAVVGVSVCLCEVVAVCVV